jgi:hypothetical protein
MRPSPFAAGLVISVAIGAALADAQTGAEPGDPMRIAILVDNSQIPTEPLPFIRRGLQQFLNALPPNHELMLVTTGGQLNIRVEPTRDYLRILESANAINVMRSSGNALIGSVEEVYDRYFRGVERRYPMLVVIANDGQDMSQRVTNESVNALLNVLKSSHVLVNGVLLNQTAWTGLSRSSQIKSFTMEMIERTGGVLEQASVPTTPSKLKTVAGHIGQQYKQLSPDRAPTVEFRK